MNSENRNGRESKKLYHVIYFNAFERGKKNCVIKVIVQPTLCNEKRTKILRLKMFDVFFYLREIT